MEQEVQKRLDELDKKMDFLVQELEAQRRVRQELEELKSDLTLISKDLFSATVKELEDVQDFVDTGDFIYLLKKVLRNTNTLTAGLEQIESVTDLVGDAMPIAHEVVIDAIHKLDEFDRKGYFTFIKNMSVVTDEVITELQKDRILEFRDQIPKMLRLIEIMTDKVLLEKLVAIAEALKTANDSAPENISSLKLMKEALSPESKSAMYKLLQVLKSFN